MKSCYSSKMGLFLLIFILCGFLFSVSPILETENEDYNVEKRLAPQGAIDAELEIDSVSNSKPICGEVLDFHIIANAEEALEYIIPVRLYVDIDLNDDGTAFDDAIGETRFIHYGSGYISFIIPSTSDYQPGLRTFTVKVEEASSLFHGSDDIQVEIIEKPQITINNPSENKLYGISPPTIDMSFTADEIQSKKYKVHNQSVVGEYETWNENISASQWNSVGNGSVSITFELKDTSKHTVYETLKLNKDIRAPYIDLGNWIEEGHEYNDDPPRYSVLVLERNLKEAWYTLNNGNKVSLGKVLSNDWVYGNISQSEWEQLPNGNVEIRFYATDLVGNEASVLITVIKKGTITSGINGTNGDDDNSNGLGIPEIPGYELEIVMGNIMFFTVLFIVKFRKKTLTLTN